MWNQRVALHASGLWSCGKFACVEFARSQSCGGGSASAPRWCQNEDTRALRNFAGLFFLGSTSAFRPVTPNTCAIYSGLLWTFYTSTSMYETSGCPGGKNWFSSLLLLYFGLRSFNGYINIQVGFSPPVGSSGKKIDVLSYSWLAYTATADRKKGTDMCNDRLRHEVSRMKKMKKKDI